MNAFGWIRDSWECASVLGYLALLTVGIRTLFKIKRLSDASPPAPAMWPRLSVILPACNEAASIEGAILSLLETDYPNLEIVLVEDRSTDETPKIVDRLAKRDPRVRAIHITSLPEGWLGKLNALARGLEAATGEWILFADADVVFSHSVLRKTIGLAIHRNLDHLTVAPRVVTRSFAQAVVTQAFGILFFSAVRFGSLSDPKSDAAVGLGAFNLFRKSAYDKSAGLEWLRLEVADDVGLGLLLKRAGAKSEFWLGAHELAVLWYPSLIGMARGLEKNMFAVVGHYRVWRAVVRASALALGVFGLGSVILSSFLATLGRHSTEGFLSGEGRAALVGSLVLSTLLAAALVRRRTRDAIAPGLFIPLGLLAFSWMILRSTWICARQGGIVWRGTKYPSKLLRAGQRVVY